MSRLDVVTAQSQVAASQRDLIVAQTNLRQQETTLKQLLSKRDDPDLDSAEIVVTDLSAGASRSRFADLRPRSSTALANRPESKMRDNNLQNQDFAIAYARTI